MEAGILAVVLVVLMSAVMAVRRDPRFDRRETFIQLAWIAAFIAGCAGLALLMAPLARRICPAGAAGLMVSVIAGSMVMLARYLKQRLEQRDRDKAHDRRR